MLVCITFLFGTMVELAIVCYISLRFQRAMSSLRGQPCSIHYDTLLLNGDAVMPLTSFGVDRSPSPVFQNARKSLTPGAPPTTRKKRKNGICKCVPKIHCCAPETIDRISIYIFPLGFTIFNIFYWWYYVGRTGREMWTSGSELLGEIHWFWIFLFFKC